ncbi:MAG: DUF3592 domain-containing protein [Candidatus Thiodiazotropha sp.]
MNATTAAQAVKLVALFCFAAVLFFFAPQYAHHILLLIAAILIIIGAGSLLDYRSQSGWRESRAKVLSIEEREEEIATTEYSRLKYFYPVIEYEYTADGQSYRGSTVSLEKQNIWVPEVNNWGDATPKEDRWWRSLKPGDDLPIHINTRNHDETTVIKGASKARRSHHLALIFSGILIALIWLTVVSFKSA